MTDEQKQKLKDYQKEYYKKYYIEKKLIDFAILAHLFVNKMDHYFVNKTSYYFVKIN